jgi:hypothetical protein
MAKTTVVVARESVACTIKGEPHVVQAGQRLPSTHPVVKAYGYLFAPAAEQLDVEEPRRKRGKRS